MAATVIGPYTAGEIPPPLTVLFKDAAGNAIDFSQGGPWAARFVYRSYGGAFVTRTVNPPPSQASGAVTYAWVAADMAAAGDYEGEMWVGDGGPIRYDSVPLAWQVQSALAVPAPSV